MYELQRIGSIFVHPLLEAFILLSDFLKMKLTFFKANSLKIFAQAVVFLLLVNLVITVTVDRFMNDSLTETQLLKRVPQTFFWKFD